MVKSVALYILVILLGVTLLTVFRLCIPPAQSELCKSSLKGKILFRKEKRFYLMNANGTNIKSINIIRYPILSSRAKKIAWIVYENPGRFNEKEEAVLIMDLNGKNSKVFKVSMNNGVMQKIETGDKPPLLWGMCWSANDEVTLYYTERFKNNPRSYKIAMNIDSGDCRIIKELSCGKDNDYDDYWNVDLDSPDGTKTFAKAAVGNTICGCLISKISREKSYVPIPFYYSHITWSPDSNKLVYAEQGDMYTINSDGADHKKLTNYKYPWYADPMSGRGGYEEPSWSPDSRCICCTYIERIGVSIFSVPSMEIHVVDPATRSDIFLTKGEDPMWLPEEFNIPDTILSYRVLHCCPN